jgi:hypothetical protein
MKEYFKKISVFIFLFVSAYSYSQKGYYEIEETMPFQPMFSLGSGFYSFQGDVQGPKSNVIGGGNIGFNGGIRLNMSEDFDVSLVFSSFSLSEDDSEFKSRVNGVGLHCDYTISSVMKKSRLSPFLSFGVERINFKTESDPMESSFMIPVGLGIMLNVSERINVNIGVNYAIAMADIDKTDDENNDNMMITDFTIHYDLFTPKPRKNIDANEAYYNSVNFEKFDFEDEDGDLVPDSDDFCPKTPQGVEVDVNGCPLDTDYDGIPNYIDEEEYTTRGAVVNERGVKLKDEEFRSMYSDYASASRRYATHYNNYKILEDNYKTTNDYLIAKANAFNKAFNEGKNLNQVVDDLRYRVKIASYNSSVPADEMNNLLSVYDLQSFAVENDVVIYVVGSYTNLDDATNRMFALEEQGFEDTYIMIDNNGEISNYIQPAPAPEIDDEEEVVTATGEIDTNNVIDESAVKEVFEGILTDETIYRIQVGAYSKEQPLSDEVFAGVDNVISFTGKDGLIRYMTGSFIEYKDAIDYQAQMKARGFEDAFIVTYKNGERISLNVALKPESDNLVIQDKDNKESPLDLRFTVQIMVGNSLSAENLDKTRTLGNIDREQEGTLYKYYAGSYLTLAEANIQLEKVKIAGFSDAFIFATNYGQRITIEAAEELLK